MSGARHHRKGNHVEREINHRGVARRAGILLAHTTWENNWVQTNENHMNRLAYPLPDAARIPGVSRTRIFEAVRKQELTIRKAGRA